MLATLEGTHFLLWLLAWPLVAAPFWAFHARIHDPALKRRWFPWMLAVAGCLAFALFHAAGVRGGAWLFAVPMSLLILGAHLYSTRFCSACGASLFGTRQQLRPKTCHECGAALIDEPPA